MSRFFDLLERNVLVSSFIAAAFSVTVLYMYAVGKPVPPELLNALMLILGYFFGAKAQNGIVHMIRRE